MPFRFGSRRNDCQFYRKLARRVRIFAKSSRIRLFHLSEKKTSILPKSVVITARSRTIQGHELTSKFGSKRERRADRKKLHLPREQVRLACQTTCDDVTGLIRNTHTVYGTLSTHALVSLRIKKNGGGAPIREMTSMLTLG